MSNSFEFVTNENAIQDGPKYELRSGDENRKETDRNLLPLTASGWPNAEMVSVTKSV
jgi:hypothetical protein